MAYINRSHNLGWSNTRITVLEYCQKKYFFNYYTHTLRDMNEKLRLEAMLLKNLKSMEMRMGEKTHHILSDYLRLLKQGKVEENTIQKLKDEMTDIMKKEFQQSKDRDFSLGYNKDQKFGLSEHYYGENVDDKLDEIVGRVIKNFDAFLNSEWHDKVKRYFEVAKQVFVENPKVPDYENMKINVNKIPELMNVAILASPDFGVIFDDNTYLILDWKSGKEGFETSGVADQLKVYVLKMLLKKWSTKMWDMAIKAYEIYFPSMNVLGGEVTQEDIDGVIQKIIQDVDYQKQFIVDQDVVQNIAVSHKNFQRTTSPKKCKSCTFRKVCEELKTLELSA